MNFKEKYGSWALVAGASEGMGAEFARQLAARGLNLVLVARRADVLDRVRKDLLELGVQVRTIAVDLADRDALTRVIEETQSLEIGLLVYNAAYSPSGPFLEQSLTDNMRTVEVNVRGPLGFAHHFGRQMASRKRGGIVLLSSLTAFQGSPYLTSYGATKAFNLAFAEGLWFELQSSRVDVLAVCAGATTTPNFLRAAPKGAPGMLPAMAVVSNALDALGRRPMTTAGFFNALTSLFMRRVLTRQMAVKLMGSQTRKLQLPPES